MHMLTQQNCMAGLFFGVLPAVMLVVLAQSAPQPHPPACVVVTLNSL